MLSVASTTASAAPATATVNRAVAGLPPPDLALPVLAPVNNREQYRKRGEDETEEAQWYSAEEPDTMVEPQQVRLKSLHSKAPSVIVFTNKTTFPVRALWLDFEGNEVVYSVLDPNSTKRYHTYVTHPWIVRELHSSTRMMLSGRPAVVGLSTEQTVEIQAPKQLPWTLDTHRCFPEQYKLEAKALLLCHKKLEVAVTSGSTAKTSAVSQLPSAVTASPIRAMAPLAPGSMNVCAGTPLSPGRSMRCTMPLSPRANFSSAVSSSSSSMPPRTISPLGMLTAPDVAGPSTATSISISSDATQFTATLTVTSPRRAALSSRMNMNIEVTTGGLGSTTNINFNTVLDGCDTGAAIASASTISGCVSPVARKSDKKGIFSMFKNMLHPKQNKGLDQGPATTTFKLQVQTAQDTQKQDQSIAAPVEESCWPPLGTHLGHLPSHLMVYIAELAQPVCWQTLQAQPMGRPDIQPTLMACSPNIPEDTQEEQQGDHNQQGPPVLV